MLKTECCHNYICFECIKLLEEKETKCKKFTARCPHCCKNELFLVDVNVDDPVKKYTDTPYLSFVNTNEFEKSNKEFGYISPKKIFVKSMN